MTIIVQIVVTYREGMRIVMHYGGTSGTTEEILLFMAWEVIQDVHLIITNNNL